MARLTIPTETTVAEFTVSTLTEDFPIAFSIFTKDDLSVTVDGVASAFSFTGTKLEGGGYNGGTVSLPEPILSGAVRIVRDVLPARTSNFAPNASVPIGSVDLALNRLTATQQDQRRQFETVFDDVVEEAGAPLTAATAAAATAASSANTAAELANAATTAANTAAALANTKAGLADAAAGASAAQTALAAAATTSANTAADAADIAAAYALAAGRVVETVADLSTIVSPAIGDGARVVADPLGDVTDGNGEWTYDGADWVWVAPLVYPVIQEWIDQVETDVVETITTNNLYDPAQRQDNFSVSSSNGNRIASTGWACSDWIPVTAGAQYTISANATKRYGVSFFTSYGATTAIVGSYIGTTTLPLTVTAPVTATHMLVNVQSNTTPEPSEIMINAGATALPYEAVFDPYLLVRETALPETVRSLIDDLEADVLTTIHPVNLYNPADTLDGSYVNTGGTISSSAGWGMVYIDVTEIDVVTINANSARRAGSSFFTEKGSAGFMTGTYSSSLALPETRAVPEGAVWLGVNLYSSTITEPTEFMVSATEDPVPYEAWEAPRLGVRADAVAVESLTADERGPVLVLIGTDAVGYVESNRSGTLIRRGILPYFTPRLTAKPGRMNLVSDSVDGVMVRGPYTDDTTPDHTSNGTIGGQHGYFLGTCTATAHGKTTADQGSTWTNGGHTYVLVQVVSVDTLLLARTDSDVAPSTGAFVHAAGATNTGTITVTASVSTQWYPPHNNYSMRCLVDGREITETGGVWEYDQCVQFIETCDIIPRADIIAWWIANGGVSGGLIPDGDPLYTMTTTYVFDRDAQLTIHRDWFFYRDTTVQDLMGLQVTREGTPDTFYIPGAVPFTYDGETLDYGLGVASDRTLTAPGTPDIELGPSRLQAAGEYAHRALSLWADYVHAVGFLPVADAALDVRRTRVSAQAFEIRGNTAKHYFRLLDVGAGTVAAGSHYGCVAYRHILPRVAARTDFYVVRQSEAVAYVYADWHDKAGFDRLDLPSDLIGRPLTVIDSRNATISASVASGSLVVETDAAGDYGYLIVKAG